MSDRTLVIDEAGRVREESPDETIARVAAEKAAATARKFRRECRLWFALAILAILAGVYYVREVAKWTQSAAETLAVRFPR